MEVILEITALMTLAMALSFLIERLLEIIKAVYDLFDSQFDWYRFWTLRTYKVRNKLEKKLRIVEYLGPKNLTKVLNKFGEKLLNRTGNYSGTVPILAGDLIRAVTIKSWMKLLSIGLGIALAFWMNVDLIKIWQDAMSNSSLWIINIKSQEWRIVISGIVIGLGSNPLHKVITTIEKKSRKYQEKKVQGEVKL